MTTREGGMINSTGELQIHLADMMTNLLADEDRIKSDQANLDTDYLEVNLLQESLQVSLSSLLMSSSSQGLLSIKFTIY